MSNLIIIPTYNEIENIENIIRKVFSLEEAFSILIIDDGSPDGTAMLVKGVASDFPDRIHLLERKGKLGLGTAYIAGFKWALDRHYDYIFEMDCDFSHNPQDLVRLRIPCAEGDAGVTVGSRYVKGGGVVDWPLDRRLISKGASIYVNMILWLGVKDSTAGFVAYKREVLETMDLNAIRFIGYAFQIEMKFRAKRLGFKITEVPISFCDRILGTSKMSLDIFNEAFLGVLKMRFLK